MRFCSRCGKNEVGLFSDDVCNKCKDDIKLLKAQEELLNIAKKEERLKLMEAEQRKGEAERIQQEKNRQAYMQLNKSVNNALVMISEAIRTDPHLKRLVARYVCERIINIVSVLTVKGEIHGVGSDEFNKMGILLGNATQYLEGSKDDSDIITAAKQCMNIMKEAIIRDNKEQEEFEAEVKMREKEEMIKEQCISNKVKLIKTLVYPLFILGMAIWILGCIYDKQIEQMNIPKLYITGGGVLLMIISGIVIKIYGNKDKYK
jgi:hypothetical protein